MPYSGPSDPALPAPVKALPEKKRRAFVHAFNSAYADHHDGEDAKRRESRAFAIAHAAANRAGEKSMPETGMKYDEAMMNPVPVSIVEHHENPYRMMMSFSDLDAQREAEQASDALSHVFGNFKMLSANVLDNEDLSADQKAAALNRLTAELSVRLEAAREDPESAYKDIETAFTQTADDPGAFVAFKDASGAHRWVTIHTNKFRDKIGETLADAAHREYVEWANGHKANMPVLRFWHIPINTAPGTPFDLGQADLLAYDNNGFVVASGTFYADKADVAERLSAMKDLGCSHGYVYRASDLRGGVLHRYRTFEVTIVPRPFEANQLTLAGVSEEGIMLTGQQREAALKVLGEERVKALEEQMSGMRTIAEASGISYKALTEALTEPAEATTEPVEATPVPAEGSEPVPAAEAMPTAAAEPLPQDTKTVPDGSAALVAAMASVVDNAVAPLRAELADLRQGQKTVAERLAIVETSDEERLAARIAPRTGPLVGAKAASAAPETALPDDLASQIRETFKAAELPADPNSSSPVASYMPGILASLQSAALFGADD